MLTGRHIEGAIRTGEVEFRGLVRGNALLLTLGKQLLPWAAPLATVEPWKGESIRSAYGDQRTDWREFRLEPKASVLIAAREYLRLPLHLGGAIGTLSHVARLGLFSHFSSPFVGPGFAGYLCLELFNASPHVLVLRERMPVAKVVLFPYEGEAADVGPFYYSSSTADEPVDLRSRVHEEFGAAFGDDTDG